MTQIFNKKWARRYLRLAFEVAKWSKDPSSKIGAIVVGEFGQILATGYNGFPRGIEDTEERLNEREKKLSLIVHAEMNCIYNASLSGISLLNSTIYVSGLPTCSDCAKGVIQSGIKAVCIREKDINISEHWKNSWDNSKQMFIEAGLIIHEL